MVDLQKDVEKEHDAMRYQLSTDHAGYEERIRLSEDQLHKFQDSFAWIENESDELLSFGRQVGEPLGRDQRKKGESADDGRSSRNFKDFFNCHGSLFLTCAIS